MTDPSRFYVPRKVPRAWENFWMPLLLWIVLYAVDLLLLPGVFALPFLLLVALVFLAFRLPAWMVAVWAFMYAGSVLIILSSPVHERITDPAFLPYVRTVVFLGGGMAAVLLANQRQRLEKGYETLFGIVSALPLPVIVSDISGNILLLNQAAQLVLKNHVGELSGLSFFSTFVGPTDQGLAIARYIGYFDPSKSGPISTRLQTRSTPSLTLHAVLSIISVEKSRLAVTVVERVE